MNASPILVCMERVLMEIIRTLAPVMAATREQTAQVTSICSLETFTRCHQTIFGSFRVSLVIEMGEGSARLGNKVGGGSLWHVMIDSFYCRVEV